MQSEAVPFKHPWKETNLGSVSVIEVGGTPSTAIPAFWSGGDIPWMSSGDVHQRRIVDVPGRITKLGFQSSNAKLIEPPAVAMALAGQGKTRGTVALTLLQVCTNQSVALVKGQDGVLDTSFLFHALDARYEELRARSEGGGRAGLSKAIIEAIPIPLPSLEEQQHITEILDTVDETIALTTSLIAKLKQIRAGLLHDLLTRGLDEDGKLRDAIAHPEQFKDSPLGLIPKDWEVDKFEKLADAIDPQPDHRAPPEVNDGEPYIGVGDFRSNGSIDFNSCRKVSSVAVSKQQQRFSIEPGDIIFGKIGTIGLPKFLPQADYRYALNANTILIKPRLCPSFVLWLLQSNLVEKQIQVETHSTSQPAFGILRIRAMLVPISKPEEQIKIITLLDAHENRIRTEEAYLDKLKLQKKGLMHDLLTGRVRVNTLQQVSA